MDPAQYGQLACQRCGITREARKGTVLCRDCRTVLTAPERLLWAS